MIGSAEDDMDPSISYYLSLQSRECGSSHHSRTIESGVVQTNLYQANHERQRTVREGTSTDTTYVSVLRLSFLLDYMLGGLGYHLYLSLRYRYQIQQVDCVGSSVVI